MKRPIQLLAIASVLGAAACLSGCIYDPAYYHRTGVVYSSGNAAVDYDDDYNRAPAGYYYPSYSYYGPYSGAYYGYGYGWGWPLVSLGFYGSYYNHHGYRGGYHGGHHPHSSSGHSTAPQSTHHH